MSNTARLIRLTPIVLAIACLSSTLVAHVVRAEIRLPSNAPEPVRWAAADLESALKARHISLRDAAVNVTVGEADGMEGQSFSIRKSSSAISIHAGGPVGGMYALQDVAEQVTDLNDISGWAGMLASIHESDQKPFVEIRADNPFIHVYPLLLRDLDHWHAYIDMLARNRFNLLDMHGAYDLSSTSFPNLYPMLVHVPEYPNVGDAKEQVKNLASFQDIIAYAGKRGIKVSFMNYSANNGRCCEFKNEPSITGVPPEKLADYTAKAVALLIQELPGLYMLGFRVGESGQNADFYRKAYIKGVNDANRPDLRLYTRSWQTTKEQLLPIAEAARNGFDIEIKYNGEQLGLPYQAMQGAQFGTYSYQGYLDVPANYQIIWQVRANGTHRFWAWENTDFIRRTVHTFQLGNARGFTLEPHVAYFSIHPSDYYKSPADVAVYKYIWQRHWMWYYAWGRLGYNPNLPESTIVHEYEQHFGAGGKAIYDAMQASSQIVPLAYAYRFVGPDQRDFSPETETGNFDTKKKRARQDLLQFAENKPEDERSFVGIDSWVDEKLAGHADGRYGPFAVANRFQQAANATRQMVQSAPPLAGRQADEWRLLRADLLATSYFADYYVHRIQGMAHLEFALKTGDAAMYATSVKDLQASRESWSQLGQTTGAIFKPLSNPLRRQLNYEWSSQVPPMERLDATADTFWAKAHPVSTGTRLELNATDRGENAGLRVTNLSHTLSPSSATITCIAEAPSGIAHVNLWYKGLPSELAWRSEPMQQVAGKWTATVPLDAHGLLYLVELQDSHGQARNFPDERLETPYRVIPATPATVNEESKSKGVN